MDGLSSLSNDLFAAISTPFHQIIIEILSFNKFGAEEVPLVGMKMFTHLKAYVMQRNYTSYISVCCIRDEHYLLYPKNTSPKLELTEAIP